MPELWNEDSTAKWSAALSRYSDAIASQSSARLPELDAWYRDELPPSIAGRRTPHVTHAELVKLTEWKMARGVWRAPNLVLVRGNEADDVVTISSSALAAAPHPTKPIKELATLAGVGPATASAIAAAALPALYPFFDELVAAQVPALGAVKWTLGYYAKYADALRERASALGGGWTPVMVERALWSNANTATGGATTTRA